MTPSALDRLRPLPGQPDSTWAADTLSSILASSPEPRDGTSTGESARLIPVGGPTRGRLTGAGRRTGLVAAAVVLVVGVGMGLPWVVRSTSPTVLANPSVPVSVGDPNPVMTDRGPLTSDQRRGLLQDCEDGADPSPIARVLYARATSDGSDSAPRLAAVVEDRRGEYRLCVSPPLARHASNTMLTGYGPHVLGPGGVLSPTEQQPLSLIASYQWRYVPRTDRFTDVHLAIAYAVAPEVHRVEVRLSGEGADGRWFAGAVHGSFVHVPIQVPELDAPDGVPAAAVEARGYAADGRLIATSRQDYLNGTRDSHGDERSFWQ